MELVGRDPELAAMARSIEAVRAGAARIVGILGEAGIGKTELLAATGAQARAAGLLVLDGRAAEHESDVPFGVVIDAFGEHVGGRRIDPLLAEVLPAAAGAPAVRHGPAERFHYHRALRDLLQTLARERGVALLLDDLHCADEASVEFVLHLLRRPPRGPCLLAFGLRRGRRGTRLLAAARATPGWLHLPLGPLSDAASLALLADVADERVRARVAMEAAGNPLYLHHLARVARSADPALPATLAAAVTLEVDALEPASRTLLDGAAVAGDPFDPELAAATAGVETSPDALDRLVAAELVRATGQGRAFEFRHPLVRRAVYDALPPAWRLAAHERAAAALEGRGAAVGPRAYHVEKCARVGDGAAIELLVEAAAAAAGTSPATAAHWYGAALRLVGDQDGERRVALLAAMAPALADAGRLQDSRAAMIEALDRLDPAPVELVSACAQVELQLGLHRQARRRLLSALEGAPADAQAAIALELAADAMTHGRGQELRTWAVHAGGLAGEPVLLAGAEALGRLGAVWTGDAALARASSRLRELDNGELAPRVGVMVQIARAQLRLGHYREAAATTTRALDVCRAAPHEQLLVWLRIVRAWALTLLLDLDAALADAEAAEESARLQCAAHPLLLALCKRVLVHHQRAEAVEAERAAVECASLMAGLEASAYTTHVACVVAELRCDRDPERCIEELQVAAGLRFDDTDPSLSSSTRLVLVRAAIAAGRVAEADDWATAAAAHAARLRLPILGVRALCGRAEVMLARDEAALAAGLAQDALTVAHRITAPLDEADARLLAGRAFAATGDRERAKAELQRVAADAGAGGAFRLRDRAARELRLLGMRVSAEARRATGDQRLSERERRVAELVAQGHSNKQVAATLYLSEKTIMNTLTRIYAKLGVRSRTQLARAL